MSTESMRTMDIPNGSIPLFHFKSQDYKYIDAYIENMKNRGWDTVWSENRKHITFINDKGEKVRDSNITKKFNVNVSKESLEELFSGRDETYVPEPEPENIEWKCAFLGVNRDEYYELMKKYERKPEEEEIKHKRTHHIELEMGRDL